LGLSNVSFGLSPATRQVLNSVFLHEARQYGLDSAIVHASKILPLARIPEEQITVCQDLIYDRRKDGYDPLTALLELFAGVSAVETVKVDRTDWTIEQILRQRIIDGDREGLIEDLEVGRSNGIAPLDIINEILLDGMREVGELFGSGRMQLPFVLQSAETMKTAVAHLEQYMEKTGESSAKGKLVLATVKGDVHDIGKNLVDIICTNNGYEVHNIGIKIGIQEMIDKVKEVNADALGMSGLLVKSTIIMRDNLQELNTQDLSEIPVLLGGAALTRSYVEQDLRKIYDGRVFYGKDAFEGLSVLDTLMNIKKTGVDDPDFGRKLGTRLIERAEKVEVDPSTIPARSPEVETDNEVFTPPFLGTKVVKGIGLDEIAEYINETALFRNQWQYRPNEGETDADFKERIRPLLREQLSAAKSGGYLVPQVVYGYFPVNADGNDLIVWTDDTRTVEKTRFHYPRQKVAPFMCIADFYRSVESGEKDYAAFHIVTMGSPVSEKAAELFAENKYNDYMVLHGIGVEMAEALAEYWHHRIRTEWGYVNQDGPSLAGLFRQQYRGGRYSWGYPACPDLEDNATVAELLEAGRIGIEVSEETGWQYQPEQTTSAIICHHPKAKYFVARD
jgi:5-methyltetrahydrofolate--homocysteine methyltransferase